MSTAPDWQSDDETQRKVVAAKKRLLEELMKLDHKSIDFGPPCWRQNRFGNGMHIIEWVSDDDKTKAWITVKDERDGKRVVTIDITTVEVSQVFGPYTINLNPKPLPQPN